MPSVVTWRRSLASASRPPPHPRARRPRLRSSSSFVFRRLSDDGRRGPPTPAPASSRIGRRGAARLGWRVLVTALRRPSASATSRRLARPRTRARARRRQAPVRLPHRHPPRARRAHPRDRVRSPAHPITAPLVDAAVGARQARARRPPRDPRRVWNAPMRVPASVRGGDGSCPAPPPRPLRQRFLRSPRWPVPPRVGARTTTRTEPGDVLDHRTPTEDEPPREHEPSSETHSETLADSDSDSDWEPSRATRLRVRGDGPSSPAPLNRILLSTIQSRGCPPAIAWISNWRLFSVARRTGVSTAWTTQNVDDASIPAGSVVLGAYPAWGVSSGGSGGDDGDARAPSRVRIDARFAPSQCVSFANVGRSRDLPRVEFRRARALRLGLASGRARRVLAAATRPSRSRRSRPVRASQGVALGDARANADVDERARHVAHVDASLRRRRRGCSAAAAAAKRFRVGERIATCSLIVAFSPRI